MHSLDLACGYSWPSAPCCSRAKNNSSPERREGARPCRPPVLSPLIGAPPTGIRRRQPTASETPRRGCARQARDPRCSGHRALSGWRRGRECQGAGSYRVDRRVNRVSIPRRDQPRSGRRMSQRLSLASSPPKEGVLPSGRARSRESIDPSDEGQVGADPAIRRPLGSRQPVGRARRCGQALRWHHRPDRRPLRRTPRARRRSSSRPFVRATGGKGRSADGRDVRALARR